ncbi:AAA family ATPase [Pseudoalteromonas piscicida]|uniref:AAA family ATPase n=1 Tax=Pseudoalteromonas piscicida TaxID=43662 RepID=UPI0005F9AE9D|nr:ATP-binding protein [Pseudoalteromonas piscicida]KJZ03242.1 RloA protein [Pseudoalteromonas piscicida]
MLIDFTVRNYRSIKETQTFSMIKSPSTELEAANTFSIEGQNLSLLRSAVIYGANASGKSNVIKAIKFLKKLVIESSKESNSNEDIEVAAFKYDHHTKLQPSEFEVTFLHEGVKYQFGTVVSKTKVLEEWLIAYPKGRPQRWFTRLFDENTERYLYKFSESFQGQKAVYQATTRQNALFLSTCVQLNNKQLEPVYHWFSEILQLGGIFGYNHQYSAELCSSETTKKQVLSFLNAADMSIDDIEVEEHHFSQDDIPAALPEDVRSHLLRELKDHVDYEVSILRKDSKGNMVPMDIKEESDGTQKLFGLVGPVIDTLEEGLVLVIDELHSNLHPKMVEYLTCLFNNAEVNKKNAQLIFTTHETSILSQDIFRRDQIWFAEKSHLATSLYSLLEFSPRKSTENIELGYLSGKYGALPFVDKLNRFWSL